MLNASRRWKKNHPLKVQDRALRRRYGIGSKEYNDLLEKQDWACAICRTEVPGGKGRLHVDHDHKTGRVRGLLCNKCNRGLGTFTDNPEVLLRAVNYLNKG